MDVVVQSGVEAIGHLEETFIQEGRPPNERGTITVHLPDVILSDDLEVVEDVILAIEHRELARLALLPDDGGLELAGKVKILAQQADTALAVLLTDALRTLHHLQLTIEVPDVVDVSGIHLLLLVQDPAAPAGGGHIGRVADTVMMGTVAEVLLVASVGRVDLALDLLVVEELGLRANHPVETHGVGTHALIEGEHHDKGAVPEVHAVLIGIHQNRTLGLREVHARRCLVTDDIVNTLNVAPCLQGVTDGGKRVVPGLAVGGGEQGTGTAGHLPDVAEDETGIDAFTLAGTATADQVLIVRADGHGGTLHLVEELLLDVGRTLAEHLLVNHRPPLRIGHPRPCCRVRGTTHAAAFSVPPARRWVWPSCPQ